MKLFAPAALAAIEDGSAIVSGAVKIACDPPVLVWGGYGILPIGGDQYLGVGDRGLAQVTSAALGGSAQNATLSLSGVDPDILPLLDATELRGASAVLWRLIFNGAGTGLLDAHVYRRGRVDQVTTEETVGGEAMITLSIEGAARGLGRRGGRMRTDADQRLVKATDGSMKHVSYAGEKTLYWGGQPPAPAATATGGVVAGGGGLSGGLSGRSAAF